MVSHFSANLMRSFQKLAETKSYSFELEIKEPEWNDLS